MSRPMRIELHEEPITHLIAHAAISSSFYVERVVDLPALASSSVAPLATRIHPSPFIKDYDAIAGNRPTDCAARFEDACATLIAAFRDGERIGGVVVAVDSPTVLLLDGESGCRGAVGSPS